MHRAIEPCDRDFYEQLGWMVLFLVSTEELWFTYTDPQLVYWSKRDFMDGNGSYSNLVL